MPVLIALSGCAVPPYVPPTAGPTAKLQVRSQINRGTVLISTFDDNQSCNGRKLISSRAPGTVPVNSMDTFLPANQPVTIWLFHSEDYLSCNVQLTFHPKENNTYMIRPIIRDKYCVLPILNVTNPSEPRIDNTIVKRTFHRPFVESGPWCTQTALNVAPRTESEVSDALGDLPIQQGEKKKVGMREKDSLEDFKDLLPSK